jgi:hypothetical protein
MTKKPIHNREITIFFCLLTVIFSACNKSEKIEGGWIINQALYHNNPVIINLSSNAFDLHDDYTCSLPISENMINDILTGKGTWSCHENNDTIFCSIKTKNKIFNRNFRVLNYTVNKKPGLSPIIKATFTSDSLKLECTKISF